MLKIIIFVGHFYGQIDVDVFGLIPQHVLAARTKKLNTNKKYAYILKLASLCDHSLFEFKKNMFSGKTWMKKTMGFSSLGDLQTAQFVGIITVKKYIGLNDSLKKGWSHENISSYLYKT